MKTIRQWFQNQMLFTKILLIVSVSCCAVAVSCYTILSSVYNTYDEQLYIKTAQSYASLVGQNEAELQNLQNVTLTIVGDPSVQKNLTTMKNVVYGSQEWLDAKRGVSTVISSYMRNTEQVSRFTVYSDGHIIAGQPVLISQDDMQKATEAARLAQGALAITRCGDQLIFTRQIRQTENFRFDELAMLIGSLDLNGILSRSTDTYGSAGVTLNLVIFVDGVCVYAENPEIGLLAHDGWEIQGDNFVVQCTNNRGWVYLFYTPYDEIHRALKLTKLASVLLIALVTVFTLAVAYMVIRQITAQMERLIGKMDAYSRGQLPTDAEVEEYRNRRDEIGRLHKHFDRMAYENRMITEENYNRMLLEKEAQYKQLQYQVQPHFIFNALSVIVSIAYEHDDPKIVKLSTALSALLRESMSVGNNLISVKKECEIIESYILIQKERFGERLQFHMEIPDELLSCHIPKMTLQPLVDNAVKYGTEDALDPCHIRVWGRQEEMRIVLIVEDDGPGMEEDILQKLEEKQVQVKGNGIGLLNIQKRLHIAFPQNGGLEIHRAGDKTQVWVCLPLDSKEKDNVQFDARG